jgi:hypothetical protein
MVVSDGQSLEECLVKGVLLTAQACFSPDKYAPTKSPSVLNLRLVSSYL